MAATYEHAGHVISAVQRPIATENTQKRSTDIDTFHVTWETNSLKMFPLIAKSGDQKWPIKERSRNGGTGKRNRGWMEPHETNQAMLLAWEACGASLRNFRMGAPCSNNEAKKREDAKKGIRKKIYSQLCIDVHTDTETYELWHNQVVRARRPLRRSSEESSSSGTENSGGSVMWPPSGATLKWPAWQRRGCYWGQCAPPTNAAPHWLHDLHPTRSPSPAAKPVAVEPGTYCKFSVPVCLLRYSAAHT